MLRVLIDDHPEMAGSVVTAGAGITPVRTGGWMVFAKDNSGTSAASSIGAQFQAAGRHWNTQAAGADSVVDHPIYAVMHIRVPSTAEQLETINFFRVGDISAANSDLYARVLLWFGSGYAIEVGNITNGKQMTTGLDPLLAFDTEYIVVLTIDDTGDEYYQLDVYDTNFNLVATDNTSALATTATIKEARFGLFTNTADDAFEIWLRNIYVIDQADPHGNGFTDIVFPYNVASTQTLTEELGEFTPSTGSDNAALIDEYPSNTSDYNTTPQADSSDKKDRFSIPNYSPFDTDWTPKAVAVWLYLTNDDTWLGVSHKTTIYDGSTYDREGFWLSRVGNFLNWFSQTQVWERTPSDGLWTPGEYDSLQVGYERNGSASASARRITTMVVAMLEVAPVVVPTGFAHSQAMVIG